MNKPAAFVNPADAGKRTLTRKPMRRIPIPAATFRTAGVYCIHSSSGSVSEWFTRGAPKAKKESFPH